MGSEVGESADFVLAYARERGWQKSRTQLERRHRAGVVHPPRQVARGRGLGTVSIYPSGTAALFVEGSRARKHPADADRLRVVAARSAVPIDGVRAHLAALATLH